MADTIDAGHAIREERRPITALFADVVGSTSLAERLDAAEVKLVMADAIARGAESDGRRRLELFHAADRMAVTEQVAVIPVAYFRKSRS